MRRAWRVTTAGLAVLAALAGVVAVCEQAGWPFLAAPAERLLAGRLQRSVSLGSAEGGAFSLHLWRGIRLQAAHFAVGNPPWSHAGPMLEARDVDLSLRWRDLLAVRDGEPLALRGLSAARLDLRLEREADGRASWVFGREDGQPDGDAHGTWRGVRIARLALAEGSWALRDAVLQLDVAGHMALDAANGGRLTADAQGRWRGFGVQGSARSGPPGEWLGAAAGAAGALELPLVVDARIGRAAIGFDGRVRGLPTVSALDGRFTLAGPSLAAVGDPLRVTLPTTHPFTMSGRLSHTGTRWHALVEAARIGASRLAGDFDYDRPPGRTPMLSGRLRGAQLLLQDLGPAIGADGAGTTQGGAAGATRVKGSAAVAARAEGSAAAPDRTAKPASAPADGKVLPQREFDLPALRAMNADVDIALDRLDLGTPALQPVSPLAARLKLDGGVLTISALDARLAQGRVTGSIGLDGRGTPARWTVDLHGSGLRIEQWIQPVRRAGGPPYASGRLAARVKLEGQGRSTAELLASATGQAALLWTEGRLSHLLVEAAGLDLAQALGVALRGDDVLPVQCGAADLAIAGGRVSPKLLLVDTRDSTLWVDGSLSLASERLALVAHVAPKDFSPLALRTPVHVEGMLGAPRVSLEKGPIVRRLVPAAALLALAHPLAALLPLMELPRNELDRAGQCRALAARLRAGGRL